MMGKIKCLNCNMILESKNRFDFRSCWCSNKTFIEGDEEFARIGGIDLSKIKIIESFKKESLHKEK